MTDLPDCPVWIVSTRKTGHINQCFALTEALGLDVAREVLIDGKASADKVGSKIALRVVTPWQGVKAALGTSLPARVIIVSSGRSVAALCRFWRWRRRRDLFIVHVGVLKTDMRFADLVIASRHQLDGTLPSSREMIAIDGVLARAIDRDHQPVLARHLVVLLGGKNISYDYQGPAFRQSIAAVNSLVDAAEVTASIVFSRRTYPETEGWVRSQLARDEVTLIDASDRAGFLAAVARASHFVVYPDSITMVSECCATGKPVFIPRMDVLQSDTENARFIAYFLKENYVAPLEAFDWTHRTRPLQDQANLIASDVSSTLQHWACG